VHRALKRSSDVKSHPIVLHVKVYLAPLPSDVNAHALRLSVAHDIGQRFLDHAKAGDLEIWRQPSTSQIDVKLERSFSLSRLASHQPS
jgi:hypothetical protein